jgi:AcrR family transcriptional regulator
VSTGLRERKKDQTRRAISNAAHRLFLERGFEAVTVADVAREADVSEGTVFNYFPTKEDLFYGRMETFEAELVAAVRDRGPGRSVLAAFRDFVLERGRELSAPDRADVIAQAARLIGDSPALQAREREIVAQSTYDLAAVLAEEVGAANADVEPKAVAAALMGVQRALVEHVRASVVAGKRGRALATSLRRQAERAFARLEHGLGDYGVR